MTKVIIYNLYIGNNDEYIR